VEAEKIDLIWLACGRRAGNSFVLSSSRTSLPFIFAGLNVQSFLSITGALVGEFIGADRGLWKISCCN